jgi:tetratricopeptide (TPR) repeat protein
MTTAKILIFVLLVFAFNINAQSINPNKTNQPDQAAQTPDELLKHLSAAETFQISGDIANAAVENRAVVGIALQRIGNIAIEEGNYVQAEEVLADSLTYIHTAPAHLNLAVAYMRQNKLEKAIEAAQRAVSIDPNFTYAHYILGNIYFNKEDYNAALPHLEKVFGATPSFEVANALGLTYLYLKQLERAKLLFEEVLIAAKNRTADLHIVFARNYERTNYPLEAERELKRALAINPKHPQVNFFLGYLILQQGGAERLSDAAAAFEENLKTSPGEFNSNFFVGVVASAENKHEKAIKYFQKAMQINPNRSEVYLFLGQSQIEINDLDNAEKSLRRAIALESGDDVDARRTHFMLGRLLVKVGRREEGEKELKIASEIQQKLLQNSRDEINQILGQVVGQTNEAKNPNAVKVNVSSERTAELKKIKAYLSDILAQGYHNLGVIAVQNKQLGEALTYFAAAAEWKPDFPGLDRNWGIVSFRAGQFDKAVIPLARQLKTNPNDDLVRRMLGVSYYFTNNFAGAVETLKPLEAKVVSDPELIYFYAISLIQLKRNSEAVPILSRLADNSQASADALFYAAQGFMMMGDYNRAVKEFRQVTTLNPNFEKANYFIGQSLIRLNRFDEAEKAFARELELNPADFLAKYHLALTLIERKIEPEKTISILEQAIALKTDYADARYQLGKIYLEKGETDKAITELETALAADAEKDYIHYQLSIAYRKASRPADADRELKRYQELKAATRKNESPMGNNENSPN